MTTPVTESDPGYVSKVCKPAVDETEARLHHLAGFTISPTARTILAGLFLRGFREGRKSTGVVPYQGLDDEHSSPPGTMTLASMLIVHRGHKLTPGTRYQVPGGRIYGAPYLTVECETCGCRVWDAPLGRPS